MGPLRCIVFVNHTSRVSGAERTLLDLVRALRPRRLRVIVACPPGRLADEARALGAEIVPLHGTDAGLKLHPIRTPLALVHLVRDGLRVRRAVRACAADVVHANSTRAALIAAVGLARRRDTPLVTHVHDVLAGDRVSRAVRWVIRRRSTVVLAISEHVAAAVGGARTPPVAVVGNPVDVARHARAGQDAARLRAALGVPHDAPALAVVGQITPWKGQDLAIRALARLAARHGDAHLLVVGAPVFSSRDTRFDNEAYLAELHALARELRVTERVHFLGEREDVAELLAVATAVLVPSWEEPFGRVVIEGMAAGTPVLATEVGGPREILAGGGGRLLPPGDPAAWAAALDALLDDPGERERLGAEGRRIAAERYAVAHFVERVLDAYPVPVPAGTAARDDAQRKFGRARALSGAGIGTGVDGERG